MKKTFLIIHHSDRSIYSFPFKKVTFKARGLYHNNYYDRNLWISVIG
jgi:hypothetical protein